jgi:hypothetical protein
VATNSGNVPLTAVSISDPTAAVGTCSPVAPATLAPGATLTCTATHAVTQADLDNGSVVNTATAAGISPAGASIIDPSDPVNVVGQQSPQLSVTKATTATGFSKVGDVVPYAIRATNTGNITLSGVAINDPNAVISSCTPAAPAKLAPGATMTCSADHVVTAVDISAGTILNTASASASTAGICALSTVAQLAALCAPVQAVSDASNTVTLRSLASPSVPRTGGDVSRLLETAVLLVAGGWALLVVGRRRVANA